MRTVISAALLLLTLGFAATAWAHAFPDNSSPHVGATVSSTPKLVKVWFDGEIAPVFSTLTVKDPAGKQVSLGRGEVSKSDNTLLEARLPAKLPSGKYWVYWSVIANDGHHTAGRFPFTIQ